MRAYSQEIQSMKLYRFLWPYNNYVCYAYFPEEGVTHFFVSRSSEFEAVEALKKQAALWNVKEDILASQEGITYRQFLQILENRS